MPPRADAIGAVKRIRRTIFKEKKYQKDSLYLCDICGKEIKDEIGYHCGCDYDICAKCEEFPEELGGEHYSSDSEEGA